MPDEDATYDIVPESTVMVTMRDGARLATDIFQHRTAGPSTVRSPSSNAHRMAARS